MKVVPENILKWMSPEDQKLVGQMPATHATAKSLHRKELDEQREFAGWLGLHENAGDLTYDWSATHKPTTRRVGWPDFSIYRNGKSLFIEMKAEGGRQTDEQKLMGFRLESQGFDYLLCYSANEAIETVKKRIW